MGNGIVNENELRWNYFIEKKELTIGYYQDWTGPVTGIINGWGILCMKK